jgi:hypothetical protein
MTHLCCTACRLRLAGARPPEPANCPECDRPLTVLPPASALGHRLYDIADPAREWPVALSAAMAHQLIPPGR